MQNQLYHKIIGWTFKVGLPRPILLLACSILLNTFEVSQYAYFFFNKSVFYKYRASQPCKIIIFGHFFGLKEAPTDLLDIISAGHGFRKKTFFVYFSIVVYYD